MVKTPKTVTPQAVAQIAVEALQEKKGIDIVVLDLREVKNAVVDYFVICSGNSDTQVDALRNSVEDMMWKNLGVSVWHKEGIQQREWILLDYVDVVVHIFKKERRRFYGLEELWGDAEATTYE